MKKSENPDWRPTKLDLAINNLVNEFEQQELQGAFKNPVVARTAEKERNRKIIKAVLDAHDVARIVR